MPVLLWVVCYSLDGHPSPMLTSRIQVRVLVIYPWACVCCLHAFDIPTVHFRTVSPLLSLIDCIIATLCWAMFDKHESLISHGTHSQRNIQRVRGWPPGSSAQRRSGIWSSESVLFRKRHVLPDIFLETLEDVRVAGMSDWTTAVTI